MDLFLPWYGADGISATANAWQAFTVNDAILLVVAAFAVATWAATATQRTPAVPVAMASLTALLAIVGTVLVAVRLASPPDVGTVIATHKISDRFLVVLSTDATREYGAWVGLAACLGILIGAVRAMNDERTPRSAAPNIDVSPLPPPQPGAEGGTS